MHNKYINLFLYYCHYFSLFPKYCLFFKNTNSMFIHPYSFYKLQILTLCSGLYSHVHFRLMSSQVGLLEVTGPWVYIWDHCCAIPGKFADCLSVVLGAHDALA